MILGTPLGGDLARQKFDVCIAGAGPAGITLARALAARGKRVVLLEAGGFEMSPVSQEFYTGENVGLDYYDPFVSRLRYFGGASNHWGGRCRPLDAQDFEVRPFLPLSGWPIAKADLDAYAAARRRGTSISRPWHVSRKADGAGPIPKSDSDRLSPQPRSSSTPAIATRSLLIPISFWCSTPTWSICASTMRVGRITGAVVRGYETEVAPITVRAENYCLCLGGLENARFLLNADGQMPGGIGNGADLVGRFFAEHPHFFIADILFEDTAMSAKNFGAAPALFAVESLPNFALRVSPINARCRAKWRAV